LSLVGSLPRLHSGLARMTSVALVEKASPARSTPRLGQRLEAPVVPLAPSGCMLATWAGLSWWLSRAKLATDYLLMVTMTMGIALRRQRLAQATPSGRLVLATCVS